MTNKTEREAFEAWALKVGYEPHALERTLGGYKYSTVDDNWDGWQARAELSASTEAAAGEPDIAQLALDWVVIARKALKTEPSAADGYYNGYHDALTTPPPAKLSTETVDKGVDRLSDELISAVTKAVGLLWGMGHHTDAVALRELLPTPDGEGA